MYPDDSAVDAERLEDDLALAAILAAQEEECFPTEVVSRLIAGENPVRVYRDHRGLTIRALSDRTGLSIGYLSGIETGKRTGTVAAFKAIAEALTVDLDMLT